MRIDLDWRTDAAGRRVRAIVDDDAAEIGGLYPKAPREASAKGEKYVPISKYRKRDAVTPIRLFSGKLSGSRNGETPSSLYSPRDPSVCAWCRERFALDQMRYPILTQVGSNWGVASVCMDCF